MPMKTSTIVLSRQSRFNSTITTIIKNSGTSTGYPINPWCREHHRQCLGRMGDTVMTSRQVPVVTATAAVAVDVTGTVASTFHVDHLCTDNSNTISDHGLSVNILISTSHSRATRICSLEAPPLAGCARSHERLSRGVASQTGLADVGLLIYRYADLYTYIVVVCLLSTAKNIQFCCERFLRNQNDLLNKNLTKACSNCIWLNATCVPRVRLL